MARARRRPDEREEEEVPEEERPLDSGTIRSLQVTDASRDARIQMIGERAEEPAPSGRLEKAALYREAIEAELDAAPFAAKSERDLMQDSVNTIGQIFTN